MNTIAMDTAVTLNVVPSTSNVINHLFFNGRFDEAVDAVSKVLANDYVFLGSDGPDTVEQKTVYMSGYWDGKRTHVEHIKCDTLIVVGYRELVIDQLACKNLVLMSVGHLTIRQGTADRIVGIDINTLNISRVTSRDGIFVMANNCNIKDTSAEYIFAASDKFFNDANTHCFKDQCVVAGTRVNLNGVEYESEHELGQFMNPAQLRKLLQFIELVPVNNGDGKKLPLSHLWLHYEYLWQFTISPLSWWLDGSLIPRGANLQEAQRIYHEMMVPYWGPEPNFMFPDRNIFEKICDCVQDIQHHFFGSAVALRHVPSMDTVNKPTTHKDALSPPDQIITLGPDTEVVSLVVEPMVVTPVTQQATLQTTSPIIGDLPPSVHIDGGRVIIEPVDTDNPQEVDVVFGGDSMRPKKGKK